MSVEPEQESAAARLFGAAPGAHEPYPYQLRTAEGLASGRNLLIRAPTGSGKTLAALIPFLAGYASGSVSRIIYCLPLRTLVTAIACDASKLVENLDEELRRIADEHGRPYEKPVVCVQTGEQPEDRLFAFGNIIVCTYDQLLSGMLGCGYSISNSQGNINCAAACGAIVVFDEFHLMDIERAFSTASVLLELWNGLTQSIWMTATATDVIVNDLRKHLDLLDTGPEPDEAAALPCVRDVERQIQWMGMPLSASFIEAASEERIIVIVNSVGRAQELYRALSRNPARPVRLLHSRFFKSDRSEREKWVLEMFGRESQGPALLICTQVIEAGLDITCDLLLTEVAPMNSLIQRAGRCVRFAGPADQPARRGLVRVYELERPEQSLPYEQAAVEASRKILERDAPRPRRLEVARTAAWINEAHAGADAEALRTSTRLTRLQKIRDTLSGHAFGCGASLKDLIRESDDSISLILAVQPPPNPLDREALSVPRATVKSRLAGGLGGHTYSGSGAEFLWTPLSRESLTGAYIACIPPDRVTYTPELGLIWDPGGSLGSPPAKRPQLPGHFARGLEFWDHHAEAVAAELHRRFSRDFPAGGLFEWRLTELSGCGRDTLLDLLRIVGLTHDFGKLADRWQAWARERMEHYHAQPGEWKPVARTPSTSEGRMSLRSEGVLTKPPHSNVSSLYVVLALLAYAQDAKCAETAEPLIEAAVGAVVAHHGGWVTEVQPAAVRLCKEWEASVIPLGLAGMEEAGLVQRELTQRLCERTEILRALQSSRTFSETWPWFALLVRLLRLSDQRAASDASRNE